MALQYIIASCKDWHYSVFEHCRTLNEGEWIWVTSTEELVEAIHNSTPSYIFFLHWNWRVDSEIWSKHECVCFHMTDLPYGRGGSPLQNLILEGAEYTQVTAFRMIEELDAGPVYAKRKLSLDGRAEDIFNRVGTLCEELINLIICTTPIPIPQQGNATYFIRRTPLQSELPKECDVKLLFDHIRMLDAPSYPLAFLEYGDFVLQFSHAEFEEDQIQARVSIKKSRKEINS